MKEMIQGFLKLQEKERTDFITLSMNHISHEARFQIVARVLASLVEAGKQQDVYQICMLTAGAIAYLRGASIESLHKDIDMAYAKASASSGVDEN